MTATVQEAIYRLRFEGAAQLDAAKRSVESLSVAEEKLTRATASSASSYDRLVARLDPVIREQQRYQRTLEQVERLAQAGRINDQQRIASLGLAEGAYNRATAALQKNAAANDNLSRTTGLARHELVNLSRQAQDIGVSLASGQSPFTVLIQQGTQVADVIATSENGLRGFGRSLASIFTPARLAIGGVTAAVLGSVAAWSSFADSQREMEASLTGLGRGAGVTAGQLGRMADQVARVSNVSIGTAREIVGSLAGTGRIGGEDIGEIGGLARRFGLQTGQDAAAAGQELAKAFADPERGAAALNEKLGFLDARTREYIRSAMAVGDVSRAQRALFEGVAGATSRAEERLSLFSRAWTAFVNNTSRGADRVGQAVERLFGGLPIDERIQQLQESIESRRRGPFAGGLDRGPIRAMEMESMALQYRAYGQGRVAADEAVAQQAQQRSLRVDPIIRGAIPEEMELKRLAEGLKAVKDAIADPQVLSRIGVSAEQAQEALKRLQGQVDNFKTPLEKLVAEGELAIRQINAVTVAERAGVAADQARLSALNAGQTALMASTAAEQERNKVLAESARAAREAMRDASQNAALAGLPAAARRRMEIDFRYQENLRRFGTGGEAAAPALSGAGGLVDSFAASLKRLMEAVPGISIGSGYRSPAEQATMYQRYLANGGAPVAPPGQSNHNFGLAADLKFASPAARAEAHRRAAEFGLRFPMSYEPWHIEPVGARGMRGAPAGGGGAAEFIRSKEFEGYEKEFVKGPLGEANRALSEQIEMQRRLQQTFGASTAEVVRAQEAQRLLNEYQRQGVAITPQLAAGIADYARRAGEAAEQLKLLQEAQERARQLVSDLQGAFGNAFSGFLSDLRQGKSLSDALASGLDRLADRLVSMAADMAIKSLFQGLFGGLAGAPGGGLGALGGGLLKFFGPSASGFTGTSGLYHGGGIVGDAVPSRAVSAFAFAGAPRLHDGLLPDEFRAILRRGEGVFTPTQMRAMAPAANVNVTFESKVINNTGVQVTTREVDNGRGGRTIEHTLDESIAGALATGGKGGRTGQALEARGARLRRPIYG